MTYTDEQLRAFLAGDLPEADTKRLETEMMTDDALQRRIMSLDSVGQTVGTALRDIPEPARIEKLTETLQSQRSQSGWDGSRIAALAAMLAIGLGLGWLLNTQTPVESDTWRMEVARYQALYVPETVAHLGHSGAALQEQFDRASAALGLDLPLAPLNSVETLELRRAQVLGIDGKPLIQIAYRAADGTPFALCITEGTDAAVGAETLAGLAAYSWANETHQFLLIGGQDALGVETIAKDIQSTIFPAV